MATLLSSILILLSLPHSALAASFEDFVNNLSTDLAPLIALFGEQVCLFLMVLIRLSSDMEWLISLSSGHETVFKRIYFGFRQCHLCNCSLR